MLTLASTFMANRAARWSFVSTLATLLMMLVGCAARGPAAGPPSDYYELWDGSWAMNEEGSFKSFQDCCAGPGENLPLTPRYRKLRADFVAVPWDSPESEAMNLDANLPRCITPGIPGIIMHPLLFEISWSPGRVNMIFQDGSLRRIWTDGRTFPERMVPRPQGTSIGHWEGDTLVVETRGISKQSEIFLLGPMKPMPKTRVTERNTVKEEPMVAINIPDDSDNPVIPIEKHMHLQMTIEDPEIFFEPYMTDRHFAPEPSPSKPSARPITATAAWAKWI